MGITCPMIECPPKGGNSTVSRRLPNSRTGCFISLITLPPTPSGWCRIGRVAADCGRRTWDAWYNIRTREGRLKRQRGWADDGSGGRAPAVRKERTAMCLGQACCPREGQFGQKLVPTQTVLSAQDAQGMQAAPAPHSASQSVSRWHAKPPSTPSATPWSEPRTSFAPPHPPLSLFP